VKYRLGLNAHDPARIKLRLKDFTTPAAPSVASLPSAFGRPGLIKPRMFLNNVIGDCAIAGSIEEIRLLNASRGVHVPFTAYTAVVNYSAITGYVPGPELTIKNDHVVAYDPSAPQNATDQGTDIAELYEYRQALGLVDGNGCRHKLAAWAALTPGDFNELLLALSMFGVVGIGVDLPDYAETQFDEGKPWNVQPGEQNIVGGHYVPVCSRIDADTVGLYTWGRYYGMTAEFYEKFNTASVVGFTAEMLLPDGKDIEGFNAQALVEALQELDTGKVSTRRRRK